MDLASVIGTALAWIMVIWGIASGGDPMAFVDVPSLAITIGGALGGTILSSPMERVKSAGKILKNAFVTEQIDMVGLIQTLVSFAEKARREGLLSLEEDAGQIDDVFMKKAIQLVVDGTDPELVRNILDTEIGLTEDRHKANAEFYSTLGSMGPAFGMIGTLIGLIQMLGNLSDPDALGPGMAVALVTTMYGSMLANMIANPFATKLKVNSGKEILAREMMIEGILAIQAGENPRIVEEKLKIYLPPAARTVLDAGKEEE